jgi:hypothetical protein
MSMLGIWLKLEKGSVVEKQTEAVMQMVLVQEVPESI